MAIHMESEENEDRRKDGLITFAMTVWASEFQNRKLLIQQLTGKDGGTLFAKWAARARGHRLKVKSVSAAIGLLKQMGF